MSDEERRKYERTERWVELIGAIIGLIVGLIIAFYVTDPRIIDPVGRILAPFVGSGLGYLAGGLINWERRGPGMHE